MPVSATKRSSLVLKRLFANRPKRHQRGFTLIELMASMTVLAIGIVAIISMQRASLDTYIANRELQVAGGIMDQFLEMLQVDSLRWTAGDRSKMNYLNKGGSGATVVWNSYTRHPVNHIMRYDVHGKTTVGSNARFCLYYNWSWAGNTAGVSTFNNNLIEINAAVLTPRNQSGLSDNNPNCSNAKTLWNTCSVNLMADGTCRVEARRQMFRRISRALMVRQNISGL